ncbi:hypothetical protein P7C71_g5564, partial [Lecanoromycetidae sp. Uapishka_2]
MDMVTVTVGERKWTLPRALLINNSPYFAEAMEDWHVKTEELPSEDAKAFELFVRWIYEGSISSPSWCETEPYVHAWVLGKKLDCPIFQDLAMLQLLEAHKYYSISPDELKVAYERSTAGSEIRLWAFDQFVWDASQGTLKDKMDEWLAFTEESGDFTSDFMEASLTPRSGKVKDPHELGAKYLKKMQYKKVLAKYAGEWA